MLHCIGWRGNFERKKDMSHVINSVTRKARKMHPCNACHFLFEADYRRLGATIKEYRAIARALISGGKIWPGEVYEEVFYEWDGEVGTYRHKPEIDRICKKYDLYFE